LPNQLGPREHVLWSATPSARGGFSSHTATSCFYPPCHASFLVPFCLSFDHDLLLPPDAQSRSLCTVLTFQFPCSSNAGQSFPLVAREQAIFPNGPLILSPFFPQSSGRPRSASFSSIASIVAGRTLASFSHGETFLALAPGGAGALFSSPHRGACSSLSLFFF